MAFFKQTQNLFIYIWVSGAQNDQGYLGQIVWTERTSVDELLKKIFEQFGTSETGRRVGHHIIYCFALFTSTYNV